MQLRAVLHCWGDRKKWWVRKSRHTWRQYFCQNLVLKIALFWNSWWIGSCHELDWQRLASVCPEHWLCDFVCIYGSWRRDHRIHSKTNTHRHIWCVSSLLIFRSSSCSGDSVWIDTFFWDHPLQTCHICHHVRATNIWNSVFLGKVSIHPCQGWEHHRIILFGIVLL